MIEPSSRGGFFFLSVPFHDTYYDTNKTRPTDAPFGIVGNDNGRRYEPPPHDRVDMVSTFMLSHRRSPTAVGKPSFACFKGYYLPRRRVLFRAELTVFRER